MRIGRSGIGEKFVANAGWRIFSPPHKPLRIPPNLNKLVNPLDYLRQRTREGVVLLRRRIASAVTRARGARDLVLGEPHIHV